MKIQHNGKITSASFVKAIEGKRGDYYLLAEYIHFKGKLRKKIYVSEINNTIKVLSGK